MARRPTSPPDFGDDLFSVDEASYIQFGLSTLAWPEQARFPVNLARRRVRDVVESDLATSEQPLLVAGYSSIASLIELVVKWRAARDDRPGAMRLLLGSEPFPTNRAVFGSAKEKFTEEVRGFWLDESVSVRLSAKVIRVIQELDEGTLLVRVIPGPPALHAKIYAGDRAATIGSSNFTSYGMASQIEANARFDHASEGERFDELTKIANNFWSKGMSWDDEFRQLLRDLLQVVTWQEALARACAELLEGDWVEHLIPNDEQTQLWPSQKAGIAQALWVVENLGSVLVADATGSGKTRMGAHLVAAVRHRLLDTGRMRRDRDLTTLVCPPGVLETWQREALSTGVTIMPVSHGLLSRPDPSGPRQEEGAVARAQVLAIDEAHNFLAAESNRTRQVRETVADHVLLFTATPISRGVQDLLSLVGLLGADNFEDATLEVLERLERGIGLDASLTEPQRARLRGEIQRFTVRRTKSTLNNLVAQNKDAYRHPESGRVCRYPVHDPSVYATGETADDEQVAEAIRAAANDLRGVVQLGRRIRVPLSLRDEVTDDAWLGGRLMAARGLARHHVLAAMRSSRAALAEHIAGTSFATFTFSLSSVPKGQPTGAVADTVEKLAEQGPPEIELTCSIPEWLTDDAAWRAACAAEQAIYHRILEAATRLSPAREQAKARLMAELAQRHRLLLAFDRRPITLAVLRDALSGADVEVLVATGEGKTARKQVKQLFGRTSTAQAIALCSDALNEGLNLQGASAVVHLDLPTTLRVAEQRVGRVDRMDSPHDRIEVWWPDDGPSFATRAIELLMTRRHASEELLGSNLPMPTFSQRDDEHVVSVQEQIEEFDRSDVPWDGIHDALEPVRQLVSGATALVPSAVYAEHRHTRHRVMARVAPVASETPWAFLAMSGTLHGAPRWMFLEGESAAATIGVEAVAERLRAHLADDPSNVAFDEQCERWLDHFLAAAAKNEAKLLPRRMQRALDQMAHMTAIWANQAQRGGDIEAAEQWRQLHRITSVDHDNPEPLDPYLLGEAWWDLVRPLFSELPRARRHRRYNRLRDLEPLLRSTPLDLTTVRKAMRRVQVILPVDKRISAIILGIPANLIAECTVQSGVSSL